MYLSHYGFKEKPFDISTDPKFLWLGEKHKEAFAVLKYGVMENKGFLLLTGDVGAGKTTLINALINSVGDDVVYAFIPDPGLEVREFYRYLANAFGCDDSFKDKADFIFMFRDFLHSAYEAGKKVLLIIDEAQRLSNELLEEIRLLSNIELQDSKLLNIFFVGQAEFNTKLLDPQNRPVRQRITISNHIQPLTEKETGDYIRHRLKVAGSQKNIFSYVAIHEVYKFSAGYPRLINIVCDIALLTGYVRDKMKIGDDIVRESVESLNIEAHTGHAKHDEIKDRLENALKSNRQMDINSAYKPSFSQERFVKRKSGRLRLFLIAVVFLMVIGGLVAAAFKNEGFRRVFKDFSFSKSGDRILNQLTMNAGKESQDKNAGLKNDESVTSQMESQDLHSSAAGNFDDATKNEREESGKYDFNGKVTLDFNRNSNDFSDESYKKLSEVSNYLKQHPGFSVLVIGYTDNYGNYSYNVHLSLFRANSVKSYFIGQGIDKTRIKATGLGPENPIASNTTEESREKNRRVEIEIVKSAM